MRACKMVPNEDQRPARNTDLLNVLNCASGTLQDVHICEYIVQCQVHDAVHSLCAIVNIAV